jgi:hypothetical protein
MNINIKSIIISGIIVIFILFIAIFSLFPNDEKEKQINDNSINKQIANIISNFYKPLDGFNININIEDKTNDLKIVASTKKTYKKDEFLITFQSESLKNNLQNTDFLKKITAHELGHVLIMQNNQIDTFLTENEIENGISKEKQIEYENACLNSYFSNNIGCYKINSSINEFKKEFWRDELLTEFNQINIEFSENNDLFNEKM